jgi:hypothetical protein
MANIFIGIVIFVTIGFRCLYLNEEYGMLEAIFLVVGILCAWYGFIKIDRRLNIK